MAESGSNDVGDNDDAGGGDGKRNLVVRVKRMIIIVGVMRWGILKEKGRQAHKIVTFIVCITISKSTGHAVL